ncbi:MAG: universal stress protein [Desulfofustis sp.]|jgi:hypothetical protein|nr:universal stress protein [Desulfofustis sp.]
MYKKYLVTINKAENLTAVEFLCSFLNEQENPHVTLLHICRRDSNDMGYELMSMWENPDDRIRGRLTEKARKAIDRSLRLLESKRISIDRIVTKIVAEQFGIVHDILQEGTGGVYDAIVLGKRAAYALQWLVERPADEIAQSIIKDRKLKTPLWICPKTERDRRNVLIGVDGSDNALRAVDHVGYILSHQEQHAITLIHVRTGTTASCEDIFRQAVDVLLDHGINRHRIDTVSPWGVSVAGTIENFLKHHRQAVIAVGLHGTSGGLLKSFNLAGRTTSTLIGRLEGVSIWCCP